MKKYWVIYVNSLHHVCWLTLGLISVHTLTRVIDIIMYSCSRWRPLTPLKPRLLSGSDVSSLPWDGKGETPAFRVAPTTTAEEYRKGPACPDPEGCGCLHLYIGNPTSYCWIHHSHSCQYQRKRSRRPGLLSCPWACSSHSIYHLLCCRQLPHGHDKYQTMCSNLLPRWPKGILLEKMSYVIFSPKTQRSDTDTQAGGGPSRPPNRAFQTSPQKTHRGAQCSTCPKRR